MNQTLTILLVEDDPRACAEFRAYTDSIDSVTLAQVTNSSSQAVEYVKSHLPHAVILDLELTEGSGNGLDFLHRIQSPDIPYKPFIVVTTNNSSSTIYHHAHKAGADFIMYKHQQDYSAAMVIDFLLSLQHDIFASFGKGAPMDEASKEKVHRQTQLRKRLQSEFQLIGLTTKSKGYQYLIDATMLYQEGSSSDWCLRIAQEYKKSEPSVERAMQNAIKRTWTTSDTQDLYKYYTAPIRMDRGYPTLLEFISYYADRLTTDYGKK